MAGRSSVVHMRRPNTNLTWCGEDGPFFEKTFDREKVTCTKCRRRAGVKMHIPEVQTTTPGRLIQPGGGHRR